MSNIAVLGSQWGDEAKARATHVFAKNADWIVRFSGSGNCGATIYHNGTRIVHHQVPVADFSLPRNKAFIGSGMVVDMPSLLKEIQDTENMLPGAASRIFVDPDTFLVLPEHIEEDLAKNHNGAIRSTGKGVTPAYRAKIGRTGVRVNSLINDNNEVVLAMKKLGVQFKHVMELCEEMARSSIVFEGNQSILLDIANGNYPYCTSGDCGIGGIINSGFAFAIKDLKVYGACKIYLTKVGGGGFATEIFGPEAERIQEKGAEIGATTGRKRSIGWLDLPALKYAVIKSGTNALIVSKLDILNGYKTFKVCTAYEGGDLMCGTQLATAKPIYTDVRGWQDASDPRQIEHVLNLVEEHVGIPVEYVSYGVGERDFVRWSTM